MTICTHEFGQGGLFGHVKSAVGKIGFSRGVALPHAPMTVKRGGGVFLVMANLQSYKSGVVFWYGPMKPWGEGGPPILHTETRCTDYISCALL